MKRPIFMIAIFLIMALAIPTCFAAQYDLKKMTPEIEAALKNRQARFSTLQRSKQAGTVGENNQGYVTALQGDQGLVSQENRDRETIYQGLVTQNNLGSNGLQEVQRAFAEVQRDKASSGEMIQSPAGDWVRK